MLHDSVPESLEESGTGEVPGACALTFHLKLNQTAPGEPREAGLMPIILGWGTVWFVTLMFYFTVDLLYD